MGTRCHFVCKDCNYEAHVSGCDDVGMRCHTTTISCRECGELFDVMTSEAPSTGQSKEPVCPGSEPGDQQHDDETDRSNPDHHV